jgi:UDP-N-acetylmuramoylalanine--D-glutamate ligase
MNIISIQSSELQQSEEDSPIYDADDEAITAWLKNNKTKAQLILFTNKKHLKQSLYKKT